METKTLDCPVRTKEEILSWLNAARQRKEAWEKKVDAKFAERLRSKKAFIEETITRGYREAQEGRFAGKNLSNLDALVEELRAEA
jgi:flagellar biosynthesis/type III secretory pathway protein FliH